MCVCSCTYRVRQISIGFALFNFIPCVNRSCLGKSIAYVFSASVAGRINTLMILLLHFSFR